MKHIIQTVVKNAAIGTIGSFALLGEFTFFTVVSTAYAVSTKEVGAIKTKENASFSEQCAGHILHIISNASKELIVSAYNSAKITGLTALFAVAAYGAYKWAHKDGEYVWVHKDDLQKVTDVLGDSHNGEGHPE